MIRFAGPGNRSRHYGVLHRRIVLKIQVAALFGNDENCVVGGGPSWARIAWIAFRPGLLAASLRVIASERCGKFPGLIIKSIGQWD
jgi:hypothetical protein